MGTTPLMLSILFFIVSIISIYMGLYALYINTESPINKLFFLTCVLLSCWSIGFSLSINATEFSTCIFWRRISAIGWCSMFSFFLHYIMLLTETKDLKKRWWIYVLLYIPAVINIYVFSVSKEMSSIQYNFVKTSLGWINVSKNNSWDRFYNLYFVSFIVIGIILLNRWRNNSNTQKIKKQIQVIIFSLAITIVITAIIEILYNSYLSIQIPQIVPILIILPVSIAFYFIKLFGFMKLSISKDEIILTNLYRTKIFNYLSASFIVGGLLNFIAQYVVNGTKNIYNVILFSVALFILGIFQYVLEKIKIEKDIRLIVNSIFMSLVIPLIMLRFIAYASVTIWAFPFILVITSLLFNNSILLIMVSTSMVLTQLYICIKVPFCVVRIDMIDYLVRFGIFGIVIWIAFYVNKIYILRLKEISHKIKYQDVISNISACFINVNNDNIEEKINYMLKEICEFFKADRGHIFLMEIEDTMDHPNYLSWCNKNAKEDKGLIQDATISTYPWWIKQVKSNGVIQIPLVEMLCEEANLEKLCLIKQNVKSMLAVPLISNENQLGFLRIDSVFSRISWEEDDIKLLKITGNIMYDSIKRVASERKIYHMAYYDQLTNIPNRLLFNDRVKQGIKLANPEKLIGIIFMDLDSFKAVNDAMGHDGGDKLLTLVAQELTKCLPETDVVSRFGGDEFIIMLNDISCQEDIEVIIANITKQFSKPLLIEEEEFYITSSIGVAVYPIDGEDIETLMKNAEIAMCKAKDNGKNQHLFCSLEMKEEIEKTTALTNYLYRAQERNELKVMYQPQIDIKSGKIVALEALMRWQQPNLGLIPPDIFIPIAEQQGLISSIGEWILREACFQNKMWQEMGLPCIRIAVNVSVNQLMNPNFVSKVINALNDTGLEAKYLELEITENIAIQESKFIVNVLSELKKIGISIAIDDFGAEYSSLSRITMLPIDRLKIDKYFIDNIINSDKDKVIADTIIKLAKNLNLSVIAEGVETEQQLNYLKEKMCDEVQGYYFYKPLWPNDVEEALRIRG